MNIITKDMIKQGYEQGLIKLKTNSDSVTSCKSSRRSWRFN